MTLKPKSGYKIVKRSFGKCEEIPEMWELDKIQNHVKITTGSRNTQDKIETGKYPFFVRSKNIEKINSYSYDGEAVLTVGDGRIGEIFHYVNGKFDFHQRVYKISNFDQLLDGYFFYLYFSTFFLHRAKSMTAKNTVDSVRMNMITEMLIPLPPILEQRKIASILSEVDALIESTQKVIEKTKRLKKGLMQKLLTKGIGHTKFKKIKSLFGKHDEIPVEWKCEKLKNISTLKGRIGWQGLKQSEFTEKPDEPFLITGMNFKNGIIRWNEVYHIPIERYEEDKNIQLKKNDILMTKDGTIGKILFVDKIPHPYKASLNSHLLVFRPINKEYVPKFLFYQFQSKLFFDHIERNKSGSTFFGITQKAIEEYNIYLPPFHQQQKIASILSGVDARRHRNIIALIILRIKLAIFLILFVWISVNACKNILVAVQVTDRPLCETVLHTL